jgi:hypothetical protein
MKDSQKRFAYLISLHHSLTSDKFRCREESDPRYITNAADVKLRSFSTKVHNIEALVSYRGDC